MSSKTKAGIVALIVVFGGVLGWWYLYRMAAPSGGWSNQKKSTLPNASTSANSTAANNEKVKTVLQTLFDGIKNMPGVEQVPPVQMQIQRAIDSKDTGNIIRAFHDAIYDQDSKMSDAIPALKTFLNNPDPWIRFQAAEDLYIAGDDSGLNPLVNLMQSEQPIRDYDGSDIRVHAAEVLEKYREKKAYDALVAFCRSINDFSYKNDTLPILYKLAFMLKSDLPADLAAKVLSYNDLNLKLYAMSLTNLNEAKELAQANFDNPKTDRLSQQQLKITAAWIMLMAGEKDPYYSYLMDLAKTAIAGEPPSGLPVEDPYIYSLKILASIKDPEIKSMLEDALNSKNTEIIDIALVNLFFNQGGSDKGRQYLLSQFSGPTNLLVDSDFLMQLAAVINDPQINSAAKSVDDRTESSRWAYFEDRKNWSIFTWIDDYVVDLNGSK